MGGLVNSGKGPGGPSIIVVDDDEWRQLVSDGIAPKRLSFYVGMLAAEIAYEEDKYACAFKTITQVGECRIGCSCPPEILQLEADLLADSLRHSDFAVGYLAG